MKTSSNGVSPGHQETKTEAFSHLRRENETQVYLPKATWDMRATTVGWKLKEPLSLAISYSSCYLPLLLCLELPCIILSTGSQSSKCSSFSFPYMLLHSGVLRVFPLCCLSQVQGSARFVICFFRLQYVNFSWAERMEKMFVSPSSLFSVQFRAIWTKLKLLKPQYFCSCLYNAWHISHKIICWVLVSNLPNLYHFLSHPSPGSCHQYHHQSWNKSSQARGVWVIGCEHNLDQQFAENDTFALMGGKQGSCFRLHFFAFLVELCRLPVAFRGHCTATWQCCHRPWQSARLKKYFVGLRGVPQPMQALSMWICVPSSVA